MNWMKKEGMVIWLDESIDVIVSRLVNEKAHRPLIADLNEDAISAFIQSKLLERTPFYVQADYRLCADQITEAGLKKIIQNHGA
jgi:shikimate kinase